MRRSAAVLAVLASLSIASGADAASIPALLPELHPHLLTEVGEAVRAEAPFHSGFVAPERGGYRVTVYTQGSAVVLAVARGGKEHLSVAAYVARGVAVPRRLQATFGNLGRVAMRFRERPGPDSVKFVCRDGVRLAQRRGVYVGHFAFRGEGGYVRENLHRAKGKIVESAGRCRRDSSSLEELREELEALFEPTSGLLAQAREGVATTAFLALKRKSGSLFLASREETRGRMAIIRLATAEASKRFRADEAVTTATVSPPAPFRGTGRYRAAPDGTSTWSGGLAVDFPGAPRYPLAGSTFEVLLEVPF